MGENLVKHHFNVRARPLLANMQLGVGVGTGKGGFAIMVVIEMVVTNRMTGRCTGWERPKVLMLDFVFFQGGLFPIMTSDKKSPPEISDKLCKPPGFLFAALKNYLLSEKSPPEKIKQ